jgi:hypothetical protein
MDTQKNQFVSPNCLQLQNALNVQGEKQKKNKPLKWFTLMLLFGIVTQQTLTFNAIGPLLINIMVCHTICSQYQEKRKFVPF